MSRKVQQSKRVNRFNGSVRSTRVPSSRCDLQGKVRYRYRKDALEALLNIQIGVSFKYIEGHAERRAYKCESCNGWHLTSQKYRSLVS